MEVARTMEDQGDDSDPEFPVPKKVFPPNISAPIES